MNVPEHFRDGGKSLRLDLGLDDLFLFLADLFQETERIVFAASQSGTGPAFWVALGGPMAEM